MHIFARATNNARAPTSADDEPAGAIFAGTPSQVAIYLAAHMPKQPDTIALLTAELAHLASRGRPGDSLSFALSQHRHVTIRP